MGFQLWNRRLNRKGPDINGQVVKENYPLVANIYRFNACTRRLRAGLYYTDSRGTPNFRAGVIQSPSFDPGDNVVTPNLPFNLWAKSPDFAEMTYTPREPTADAPAIITEGFLVCED